METIHRQVLDDLLKAWELLLWLLRWQKTMPIQTEKELNEGEKKKKEKKKDYGRQVVVGRQQEVEGFRRWKDDRCCQCSGKGIH